MAFTVFYAWQSDRDPHLCKDLIREALDEAKAKLSQETGIEVEIDQDTQGVTGSPSMPDTILEKIAKCGALVADLTLTHTSATNPNKSGSNPNVMLEYGYALRAADHNLLGVANTAFGEPEQLPFDLRHRRCITYQASNERERMAARVELAEKLAAALRPMMDAGSASRQFPWDEDFLNEDTKERVALAPGPALYLNLEPPVDEETPPLDLPMGMRRDIACGLRPLAPPDLLPEDAARPPALYNHQARGVWLPDPAVPERAIAASLVTRQGSFHSVWCGCAESPEAGQGGWVNEDRLAETLWTGLECCRAATEGARILADHYFSSRCSQVRVRLDSLKGLSLMMSGGSPAGPLLVDCVETSGEAPSLMSFFADLREAAGEDGEGPLPQALWGPTTWPRRRERF